MGDGTAAEELRLDVGRATGGAKAAENAGLDLVFDGERNTTVESLDFDGELGGPGVKENGTEAVGLCRGGPEEVGAELGAEFEGGG